MYVPVRIETHNKQYGTVEGVRCPACGGWTSFGKFRNKTTGRVIFVPVISMTNRTFVRCNSCGAAYEVDKKVLNGLNSGDGVVKAIYAWHQKKQDDKRRMVEKYSVGFSGKNQTVAAVLAFLVTTLGAPFFYIGKPLYGILCLILSFGACFAGLFPVLFAVVIGGFVFALRILMGKVRDGNGKYLANARQREIFSGRRQV